MASLTHYTRNLSGKIPDKWCCAYGEYTPTGKAEGLGQVRPISLLLQCLMKNAFIDPSAQKAGIPGFPGCENVSMSLSAIKSATRAKSNLKVIRSANVYGSVPHSTIDFALTCHFVPDRLRVMVERYHKKIQDTIHRIHLVLNYELAVGISMGVPLNMECEWDTGCKKRSHLQ